MKFSERRDIQPVSQIIQVDGMDDNLRASIWNVLDLAVWRRKGFLHSLSRMPPGQAGEIAAFATALCFSLWKIPIDSFPSSPLQAFDKLRSYFFSCNWYEVYDFLEFTLEYFDDEPLTHSVNSILERELSGYRYVGGVIANITGEQEIDMLQSALDDEDFPGAKGHLQRALELLSNRESPDYRNSIKESISAVESLCMAITGDSRATLGKALGELARAGKLHQKLRSAFSLMYEFTSDEGGIRHAMLDEPNLTAADAMFFLFSCTSFINYLKSKL